jgi:hypothetical protein
MSTQRPKTWGEHVDFFDREIQALGFRSMRVNIYDVLRVLGGSSPVRHQADKACEHYGQTLEWPWMTDEVRLEACCRMACARWYCASLPDAECDDEDGAEFLSSLLVGYWNDVGRQAWLVEGAAGLERGDVI